MTASRLRITAAVCTSLLAVLAIGVDRASAFPPGTPSIPSPGGGGYQPSRPTYTRPTTPSYTRPTTPRYTRPTTPGYTRPTTPNYTNPNRPNYTNPNRPGYTTPGARNRLGQHNRYTPGRTPRTGLSGQPNRTTPGQPYQPRPGQPWQTAPVPGLSPHQRNQSNQHMQPWRQPGRTNPYGTGNVPEVSQPSVPFSSDWFAPQERSYKPLYHDKGKPRFKWRIHPDLRVLLVLIPAIIVILLMLRPVIWKYVSALRQIRKAQAESLVSIQKWRRQLSRSGADQPGQDILDNSQWDALIGSLKSSGASTKISSKLRMLTARTTLGYLGLLGCYIALVGGVGWGLWQLSPFSTILPNKLLDSIPWLAGMIAVAAFGGGWFVILLYPFVIRQQDGSVSIPLEPERAPELHKLIAAVAGHFNTPVPHEVHISALPTACISRRYLFLRRRWRLTVGLPFFSMLTPRQMVALLSHELTHTKQNHYLELSIRTDGAGNGFVECFNRLSWVRSLPSTPFGALCETLVLAPTLLIFRGMACASLYLSRKLSRELEFHADQQMACLLSPEEYEEFMNRLGRSQLAMHLSFQKLSEIYHLKTLPDNLPELIRHNDRTMPPQTPTALQKEQRKQKTLWFDTHPTDAERVAAVKAIRPYPKASLPNIFDDLSTATLIPNIRQAEALATIAHYRENIGEDYSTDLLKPTQDIIARFQSRFEAMGALNRLLGRWALPQIPIEIIDTPSIPENATFDQCTEQVQAYRQWRLDHTEQLAKSTDTLQSVFTEGIMLYFVELVNAAVPSMHSIANKHLLMTRARALQAV
ncbi:MAG: M48 family metalloprotease, partial [Phycisphaerae bacterium]|nr:M48 family metalloprotease [Phycisphaerae bacterium]